MRHCQMVGVVCAAALFALASPVAPGRAEGVRLDEMQILVPNVGIPGDAIVVLDAIVLRPDDGQPHPLAMINHGSPRSAGDRPSMSPYGMWAQAAEFARRGWVAVAVLRRGYGASKVGWAETYGPCANPDYEHAGRAGAGDIAAAAAYMMKQPYVSRGKYISVGRSAGGFATVALAGRSTSLGAAIVFAPGRGSSGPDNVCNEDKLVEAFAQFGRLSRIPVLWVSAENDHFFGPRLVTRMTNAFTEAGGKLTLVRAEAFGKDGHSLFSENGTAIWAPIVDRFLRDNNLMLREHLLDAPPRPEQVRSR